MCFFTAQRSALVTEEVVCTVRLIFSNGKLSWHSFNFKPTLLNQNTQTLSQRKTITRTLLFAFVWNHHAIQCTIFTVCAQNSMITLTLDS